jgi:hypothetical protein
MDTQHHLIEYYIIQIYKVIMLRLEVIFSTLVLHALEMARLEYWVLNTFFR